MTQEVLIDVEVTDETVAFLLMDGSIERLDDGTYRMTPKGSAWFDEWMRARREATSG